MRLSGVQVVLSASKGPLDEFAFLKICFLSMRLNMPSVKCPTCNKRLKVGKELIGKAGKCPRCKTKINFVDENQEAWVSLDPDQSAIRDTRKKSASRKPTPRKPDPAHSKKSSNRTKATESTPSAAQRSRQQRQRQAQANPTRPATRQPSQPTASQRSSRRAPQTNSTASQRSPHRASGTKSKKPRKRIAPLLMLLISAISGLLTTGWFAFPDDRNRLVERVSGFYDDLVNTEDAADGIVEPVELSSDSNFTSETPVASADTDSLIDTSTDATIGDSRRVALVMGNANYGGFKQLKNPLNDANTMADALKNVGFEVTKKVDRTKFEMEADIDEITADLEKGDMCLVFYAGHGVELSEGENFLVPVGANLNTENHVKQRCVELGYLLGALEKSNASLKVVVADCCRDNPFRGSRGGNGGFGDIEAPDGFILTFSTSSGDVAADGAANNSPFTKHLAAVLHEDHQSGLEISRLFRLAGQRVNSEMGQKPRLRIDASLKDYFLKKPDND